eukprot:g13284.t1
MEYLHRLLSKLPQAGKSKPAEVSSTDVGTNKAGSDAANASGKKAVFRRPKSVQVEYIGMDVVRFGFCSAAADATSSGEAEAATTSSSSSFRPAAGKKSGQSVRHFHFPQEECCIVPQNVRNVKVVVVEEATAVDHEAGGQKTQKRKEFLLHGRSSPCLELTDFLYVGRNAKFAIEVEEAPPDLRREDVGGAAEVETDAFGTPRREPPTVCICRAFCTKVLPAKYGPVSGISIELRGRGQASRQVNNFMSPAVWKHADKLCCVEVSEKY